MVVIMRNLGFIGSSDATWIGSADSTSLVIVLSNVE